MHFLKLFFHHFFFTFTMVIKRSGELRGESAAFGNWSESSMSMQVQRQREVWSRKLFLLGRIPWRWACRPMQVKIYTGLIESIDLWPRQMFAWKGLQMVVSDSSFGACVCHGRPVGLHAHVLLIIIPEDQRAKGIFKFLGLLHSNIVALC